MYSYDIPDAPRRIEFIDSPKEADRAVRHLLRYDMLGFDVETYDKSGRGLPAFDPIEGARMRLAQFGTPKGRAFVFDLYNVDRRFMYRMFPNPYLCVIQNAKFELKFLMYELGLYKFGPIWDTMVAEQVLAKGFVATDSPGYIPVGLDAIAERRLGVKLPKEYQKADWYKSELSQEEIEYAARDAIIPLPIQQKQSIELLQQGQIRVAELEFQATPAIAFMELSGVKMDVEAWTKRCENKQVELEEKERKLWAMLGKQGTLFEGGKEPININSGPQVMQALENYGVRIPVDKEGKRTLSAKLFEDQKHIPVVARYCEYVTLNKALSSYGPKWIDKISKIDGRIHTQIKQIGAETGRMSSPDMLLIPKDDETRNCFICDPGWVFIDADYSQCELRILAELCRDPNLLLAFDNKYDLHKFSAHLIYQVALEEVTKEQRGVAKNLNFGIVYGIGSRKFANDAKITPEEGQAIMDYYLTKAYPGMGHWLEGRAKGVLFTMYAKTMLGRIRQYRGDLTDKQYKAQVGRNAKNLPIQGTNADITKRAMALVYGEIVDRGLQEDIKMLLVIHDELLLQARPWVADVAKDLLVRNMLKAEREFLKRVPSVVDCSVMLKWSKEPSKELQKEAQDLILEYA